MGQGLERAGPEKGRPTAVSVYLTAQVSPQGSAGRNPERGHCNMRTAKTPKMSRAKGLPRGIPDVTDKNAEAVLLYREAATFGKLRNCLLLIEM